MPTESVFGQGHETMTRAEARALPAPVAGQLVYETDTRTFTWYTGSGWSGLIPPGTISAHCHTGEPLGGWLLCRGQTVSRTTYADLFAAIGTQYNTGGEAGTDFRLPDMRGRRPAGLDNLGGVAAGRLNFTDATTRGNALGDRNMPQHFHSYGAYGTTGNDQPDHAHQWPLSATQGGRDGNDSPARSMYGWDGNFRTGWNANTQYGGATSRPHQQNIAWTGTTDNALGGTGGMTNANMPPFMMLTYMIKY